MYQHNSRLGKRIQEELKRDSYDVMLDPPTAACKGMLPWWQLWRVSCLRLVYQSIQSFMDQRVASKSWGYGFFAKDGGGRSQPTSTVFSIIGWMLERHAQTSSRLPPIGSPNSRLEIRVLWKPSSWSPQRTCEPLMRLNGWGRADKIRHRGHQIRLLLYGSSLCYAPMESVVPGWCLSLGIIYTVLVSLMTSVCSICSGTTHSLPFFFSLFLVWMTSITFFIL